MISVAAVADLLRQAEAAGVALSCLDGRIAYEAPATPEADAALAAIAAQREAVVAALATSRHDSIARRLIAQGVDLDLADEHSERVCIAIEPLHPLLDGCLLGPVRLVSDPPAAGVDLAGPVATWPTRERRLHAEVCAAELARQGITSGSHPDEGGTYQSADRTHGRADITAIALAVSADIAATIRRSHA